MTNTYLHLHILLLCDELSPFFNVGFDSLIRLTDGNMKNCDFIFSSTFLASSLRLIKRLDNIISALSEESVLFWSVL